MLKIYTYLFLLIICCSSGNSFCQAIKTPTISSSDFKKGLSDRNHLRAELIEDGFTFEGYTNESKTSERWEFNTDPKGSYVGGRSIQLEIKIVDLGEWGKFNEVWMVISKKNLIDYGKKLHEEVKIEFPVKKVIPVEETLTDNIAKTTEKKENFLLIYLSQDNKTSVEFVEDNNTYHFTFFKPPLPR